MSRLDSFIRRLQAQRDILNWAMDTIAGKSGNVLEIGLGNGRTYDHLRSRLGPERIYAFDRANNANPRSQPLDERLVLGEFADTLPAFAAAHPEGAVLVHSDAGLGDLEANARQVIMMSGILPSLLAPGGVLLSDQKLSHPDLRLQPMPVPIPPDRYFVYIKG
ncbi:class I SAM-dependent methyltransferase [Ferrovibrio sp.]|uniref:class I SAM-dependent methyltransferase n=1 Tax=Ferrovibrio sp. TaxID=1917215 RepID=UPI00261B8B30|nr:class I SAM-dependent methyltransferase [Ferrovibrio sp.]